MRKKLIILAFALAATAASTLTPASAQSSTTCKKDEHLIVCPTYSFCCPNNAFCVCAP
jgi:hypothetical protein